jgi:condensin complex subunit 1
MNNHVFRKLQDAMEHPCRTRDWFGMAEQAINTIYALGERPDELCDPIIKNLTRRAFRQRAPAEDATTEKEPDSMEEDAPQEPQETPSAANASQGPQSSSKNFDSGEAFELSQLLFVVGHVAIKHIAYLELVERELKRQKGDKEAGNVHIRLLVQL